MSNEMGGRHSSEQKLRPVDVLSKNFDSNSITAETVDLTSIHESEKWAYRLRNVFTPEECTGLIEMSEAVGYKIAAVNYGDQEIVHPDYRKGFRVIIDDSEFVKVLWSRISAHLPSKFNGHRIVDINERLRFLRYEEDGIFQKHSDAHYSRPDGSAISFITLQIYLNEGFEGGETTLLSFEDENRIPVVPETGMILAFDQDLFHEGSLVESGVKYTARTEVMYTHRNN